MYRMPGKIDNFAHGFRHFCMIIDYFLLQFKQTIRLSEPYFPINRADRTGACLTCRAQNGTDFGHQQFVCFAAVP